MHKSPLRSAQPLWGKKEDAFYTSSGGSLRATDYWVAATERVIYPDASQIPGRDSAASHSWDMGHRDIRVRE